MITQKRIEQLLQTRDRLANQHKAFRADPPGELGKTFAKMRERIEIACMNIGWRIARAL